MEFRSSPFSNIPPVVKNLLIINIIFFIAINLFSSATDYPLVNLFGVYYFDSPNFRVWQVITYMFMHSPLGASQVSFMHILFNMFALFSFGPVLEYSLGSKKFLNYYILTGLGALFLQMVVQAIEVYNITGSIINPGISDIETFMRSTPGLSQEKLRSLYGLYYSPMLGASGAVFGILIAFGMLYPNTELIMFFIPVPIKAKYLIPAYILLELYLGIKQFSGDSVAHFAHLGGALFGFLLIKYWGLRRPGGYL